MNQIDLLDDNGYVVPTATQYGVPDANRAAVEDRLLTEVAPKDAAWQSLHYGRPVSASEYRTQVVPMTTSARLAQAA